METSYAFIPNSNRSSIFTERWHNEQTIFVDVGDGQRVEDVLHLLPGPWPVFYNRGWKIMEEKHPSTPAAIQSGESWCLSPSPSLCSARRALCCMSMISAKAVSSKQQTSNRQLIFLLFSGFSESLCSCARSSCFTRRETGR